MSTLQDSCGDLYHKRSELGRDKLYSFIHYLSTNINNQVSLTSEHAGKLASRIYNLQPTSTVLSGMCHSPVSDSFDNAYTTGLTTTVYKQHHKVR